MLTDAPYTLYETVFRTGSSVICNPPVVDTDEDYMFLTEDVDKFKEHLVKNGWDVCGAEEYPTNEDSYNWVALRKGKLNYLLTSDDEYYDKFREATHLATKLNLLQKEQRVALFHYVIEGEI